MTKRTIAIIIALLTALVLTGCSTATNTSGMNETSPDNGVQVSESNAPTDDLGLEMPQGYGIIPASAKGLGVYGSGELKTGSDKAMVEVDSEDIEKIQVGATVSLTNMSDMSNPIVYRGTVTGLPESVSDADDICYIEVTLVIDDTTPSASSEESAAPSADASKPASNSGTTTSSVGFSGTSSLPTSDMNVEATIYLPIKEGALTIPKDCIQEGNDGLSYVWATEADSPQNVNTELLELTKVETGETDGKQIEILSGLTNKSFIALPFN